MWFLAGRVLLLWRRLGLVLVHPAVALRLGVLLGVAVLLLQHDCQPRGIAADLLQVVIGELAPPNLDLATYLCPTALR